MLSFDKSILSLIGGKKQIEEDYSSSSDGFIRKHRRETSKAL